MSTLPFECLHKHTFEKEGSKYRLITRESGTGLANPDPRVGAAVVLVCSCFMDMHTVYL